MHDDHFGSGCGILGAWVPGGNRDAGLAAAAMSASRSAYLPGGVPAKSVQQRDAVSLRRRPQYRPEHDDVVSDRLGPAHLAVRGRVPVLWKAWAPIPWAGGPANPVEPVGL